MFAAYVKIQLSTPICRRKIRNGKWLCFLLYHSLLSANVYEKDTMKTAKINNILLLPSGRFWLAVRNSWHEWDCLSLQRELKLDLSPLSVGGLQRLSQNGVGQWQRGRENLMTSLACSRPLLSDVWFGLLCPTLKLILIRSPCNSRVCLWPEYTKPLKSSLQFLLTWSPICRDNSFHLSWNAPHPTSPQLTRTQDFLIRIWKLEALLASHRILWILGRKH